jgi:hypothetical protein
MRMRAASGRDPGARSGRHADAMVAGVRLGLQHLAATVETGRADVMAQVHLAGGRLDAGTGRAQSVVCAVHATFRR